MRIASIIAAVLAAAAAAPPAAIAPARGLTGGLGSGGLEPAFQRSPLAPMGSQAGLRGLPSIGDDQAQCRAGCGRQQSQCDVDDDECADRWRQCLQGCLAGRSARPGR